MNNLKKKFIYIFFIIFINSNLFADEFKCYFEEVYQQGDTQQGIILVKNDNIRYQYFSEQLFTIFFDRVNMITADNTFPHAWRYSNDKKNLFESVDFYAISQLDKSTLFNEEGYSIKLDKNINNDFIKKISILSSNFNIVIYLNDCVRLNIEDKYFDYKSYLKYKD